MKAQIKSTLIQIAIGSVIVVVGLMALNKFVPAFTLFPDDSEQQEEPVKEVEKMPDIVEAEPDIEQEENDFSDLELEEEESTTPTTNLPQSTKPNTKYSADKRLKADNLGFVVPREIMRDAKTKITTKFYNEYCERNVAGYQKEIELYFALKDNNLSDAILFFAAKTPRVTYFFKPQGKDNLLKIPNNFPNGSHKIEYGYVLKNDVNKREVPFYSRSCRVNVED